MIHDSRRAAACILNLASIVPHPPNCPRVSTPTPP
jgi:hypothetical protein